MAWGYWSATTVSDRARSPRRSTAPVHSHIPSSIPSAPAASQHSQHSPFPVNQTASESPEDEDYQPAPLSGRPSLVDIEFTGPLGDLRDREPSISLPPMCSHSHMQRSSPGVMRDFPPDLPLDFPAGYSVSREVLGGNVSPSPPMFRHEHDHDHGCYYHQTSAHVHHHQCLVHDVGGSDDEDLDPGYATGK